MAFIYLKSVGRKLEFPSDLKEDRAHELRKIYFLQADEFSIPLRIPSMRAALQRQLQTDTLEVPINKRTDAAKFIRLMLLMTNNVLKNRE
jgi:hypothetical protein